MRKFKVFAFFAEFAFLCRLCIHKGCLADDWECTCLSPYQVYEVRVGRISQEVLESYPHIISNDGGTPRDQRYFLLDAQGNLIHEVCEDFWRKEFFGDDSCESVGESILLLDNPDDVAFVVSTRGDATWMSVVVYKPPKNFTLSQWVKKEEVAATEWVIALLRAVDEV